MGESNASSTSSSSDRPSSIINFIHDEFKLDTNVTGCRKDAINWLIYNDPIRAQISTYPTLKQRYVMSLIYFCMGGANWTNMPNTPFLSIFPECLWDHIECEDNTYVISINLAHQNLVGEIPSEISAIDSIKVLNFTGNNLFGRIPNELANLNDLGMLSSSIQYNSTKPLYTETLYLNGNRFDDYMPEGLCVLTKDNLKDIRFDCNIPCDCCNNHCG